MIEVPLHLSLKDSIQYLLDLKKYALYPKKVSCPTQVSVPKSLEEARTLSKNINQYVLDFETYEAQYQEAKNLDLSYSDDNDNLECQIKDLICNKAGLTELNISVEQKQKVWYKAWNDGHADGYYEVYLKLCDLLELFVP
jgi:hypothetical protein